MKDLPHINQNMSNYPDNNVHAYEQYDNTFNYDKYENNITILKPCTVRWTRDTTNAALSVDRVMWESDKERDAFFDSLKVPVYTKEYASGLNIVDGEPVRLPIPYQAVQQYNYLMVQVPATPVDNNDMPYRRFYYFITDSAYVNASVSELTLSLDAFTTYQHHVEIPRIMLNRGHYPMTLNTVENFLDNPMENSAGLLTREADEPEISNIVCDADYVPLGIGELTMLFAMKAGIAALQSWGRADPTESTTEMPTYSDIDVYYGKQDKVDGVRFASAGDYSAVNTPVTINSTTDNIRPNDYTIMGIRYIDAIDYTNPAQGTRNIFNMLREYYPQFFNTVAAIYVVPSDLIQFTGTPVTLEGYTLRAVKAVQSTELHNIKLNKAMFDYPENYANLTKLYTTPYAALRVTDTSTNSSVTFDIQQCSDRMRISRKVSIAYPYLQVQMLLTGYGSNREISYQWRDLNNTNETAYIPESDYNFIKTYDIPTYALYIDAKTMYYLGNYSKDTLKDNALAAYHNAVEPGNTNAFNTKSMADVVKTNNDNSALTNKNNVFASGDTANTNGDATANTINNNNQFNANVMDAVTTLRNTNRTNVNNKSNFRNNQILTHRNNFNDVMRTNNKNTNISVTGANNTLLASLTARSVDINNASATAKWNGTAFSLGSAGASALVGSLTALASAANPVIGAGMSVVGGITQAGAALTAGANSDAMASFMNTMAYAMQVNREDNNNAMLAAQNTLLDNTYTANVTLSGNVFNTNKTLSEELVVYNNDTDKNVTSKNSNALRTTSTHTRQNSIDNNARTNTTVHANGKRTYDTAIANNSRTNTIVKENATRAQDVYIRNAKRNLELALKNNEARKKDEERKAPIKVCESSGTPLTDIYKTNGLLVQLVRQPDDIIKRFGDMFLQYGYVYNHIVENPNFVLHKYFDFWQGDILIYSIDAPEKAVTQIRDLFATGLTLWRSNDNIGMSIYENLE